ncbi:MAG: hypothetical protein D6732_16395, partial [Methanobacteriota archaeon]
MKDVMIRIGIAFTISCCLIFSRGFAQNVTSVNRVGTTAAPFLKIGAGARPIGMGGAYVALANDVTAVYWNPAGLTHVPGSGEAIFNHAAWLAETDYNFAAASINVSGFGSVGLQVISLSTPEEEVRTYLQPEGTGQKWSGNFIAAGISYARQLTDRFSIGFTGKFVQEKIFNARAQGAAFDLGILYRTPVNSLTIGASITNFGTKMQLDGRDLFFNEDPPITPPGGVSEVPAKYRTEKFDLPLNLRFGIAWEALRTKDYTILIVMDGTQPNDNTEYVNSGIEVGILNAIFLRAGYKSWMKENSEEGLTFGAGIKYDAVGTNLKFDFGWADYGRLNNVKFVA